MEQLLNVHADELATLGFEISTPLRIAPPPFTRQHCGPSSQFDNNYQSLLRQSHRFRRLLSLVYPLVYRTNYDWGTSTISLVDWDAHLAAIRRLSFHY
jgi:hypothetical protein